MANGEKWLLVEGVQGKLVPIPGTKGAYYGQRMTKTPPAEAGKEPVRRARHERYEPCRMVVRWHEDAKRAGRKRLRGDGISQKPKEVRDLIIHGNPMGTRAPTRDAARKLLEAAAGTPLTEAELAERKKTEDAARAKAIADAEAAEAAADAKAKADKKAAAKAAVKGNS